MSKLLVVVDYQKDFVDGALGYAGAGALEAPLYEKVKAALAAGWKVIFTRDTHAPDYLDTREGRFLPVPHCIAGSEGWHLYGRLAEFEAAENESVAFVDKPTFGSAELPAAARALCGGEPEEIALCGVVTNICVVSNAVVLHSAFLASTITVLKDLCGTSDDAMGQKAFDLLAGMGYRVV
ncbi:MAG TPA: cysteine hydrolase [Candidatus Fournierella merdigallinarum]|nr:cysteine hydrolase [Candidatus Fournierella merdigallinarum]